MGSCVSKPHKKGKTELDGGCDLSDDITSPRCSDLSSDSTNVPWPCSISEPFNISSMSRSTFDATLLPYFRNEGKGSYNNNVSLKGEQASDISTLKSSSSSHWLVDDPPPSCYLETVGKALASNVSAASLGKNAAHRSLDLESDELGIFSAESYFKEMEPFRGGALISPAVRNSHGGVDDMEVRSSSVYFSDSDRESRDARVLSECCTFSLSETANYDLLSNKSNSLSARRVDTWGPGSVEGYVCLQPGAIINSSIDSLKKIKGMESELSVRISSKAPVSSVYKQLRQPVEESVNVCSKAEERSSMSSLELQSGSSRDGLYSTQSKTLTTAIDWIGSTKHKAQHLIISADSCHAFHVHLDSRSRFCCLDNGCANPPSAIYASYLVDQSSNEPGTAARIKRVL